MAGTEIVRFDFHGDTLEGVLREGVPFFPLRPFCAALALDVKSQRRKLQTQPWATGVMMTSDAADARSREMFCVDRRTVLMWLATIDASRVSEGARPKLVLFQREVADAIDRAFYGDAQPAPSPQAPSAEIATLVAAVARLTKLLEQQIESQLMCGPDGAAKLRRLLKEYAETVGGKDKALRKKWRQRGEMDLRGYLGFPGSKGNTLARLPAHKAAMAELRLIEMIRGARDMRIAFADPSPPRQLALVSSSTVPS